MHQAVVPMTTQVIVSQKTICSWPHYNSPISQCVGGFQIAFGISCIITQTAAICIEQGIYYVGHGIWCGSFFIVAGIFGIAAGKKNRTEFIVSFMVLSMVAASVFVGLLLACSARGIIITNQYCGSSNPNYIRCWPGRAIDWVMIGLAVCEGTAAVVSSVICCGPLCCSHATTGVAPSNPSQSLCCAYPPGQLHYNPTTGEQVILTTAPSVGQPQYFFPVISTANQQAHTAICPCQAGMGSQVQPTSANTQQAAVLPSPQRVDNAN